MFGVRWYMENDIGSRNYNLKTFTDFSEACKEYLKRLKRPLDLGVELVIWSDPSEGEDK